MACGCEIDIIQRKYTILARGVEENILPICEKYGMTFHAYAPIERGLLTGTVTKDRVVPPGDAREDQAWWAPDKLPHAIDFVDGLKDICEEYHCTQTDLAIAFIRHGRPYVNVIYGARKIKHLEAGAGHRQRHPPGRHGGGDPPAGPRSWRPNTAANPGSPGLISAQIQTKGGQMK